MPMSERCMRQNVGLPPSRFDRLLLHFAGTQLNRQIVDSARLVNRLIICRWPVISGPPVL